MKSLGRKQRQLSQDHAARRRSFAELRHDAGEEGFSLIELVIVLVIIPMIIGAVTIALITSLKSASTIPVKGGYNGSAAQRLAESHDAQITSALAVRDIETATFVETSGGPLCPGSGSQVLGLEWNPGPQQVAVSYVTRPNPAGNPSSSLVRQLCIGGASQSTTTASHALSQSSGAVAVHLTCTTLDANCQSDSQIGTVTSQDVALVQMVVSEASGFRYTVTAAPRQYLGSTAALVASSPPLLLGVGGAKCGPGNEGLTVYGDVAVNSSQAGSIKIGNQGLTAGQVYSQPVSGGGNPVSGSYTQSPTGPPPYATGPPVVDPFSVLPAPSPFGPNTYVYSSTLSQGNDPSDPTHTKLLSGVYILKKGMNGSLTSDPGGVFFYVTGGSVTLAGNATLNLAAMTSGPYAGVLLYQVPGDTSTFSLQGTPSLTALSGVIDVSTAHVQISGNATIASLGLVAAELDCNGNTSGTFGPVPTTTTVGSSVNPSVSGGPVTFTATVTSNGGTPTGSVTFAATPHGSVTPANLCTNVALAAGTATCTTSSLVSSGSPYKITATYSGPLAYQGSTGSLTQNVLSTTSTSVTSSANPSSSGQSIQFTATVSGPGTPTGNVTFTITDKNLVTYSCSGGSNAVALTGGAAICTVPAGQLLSTNSPFNVVAAYGGDASHAPSTATMTQNVNSGTVHVAGLQGTGTVAKNHKSWTAMVTVTVQDGLGNPVAGVAVSGGWNPVVAGPSGCTTAANGQCTFTSGSIATTVPSETWTVTNLSAPGYTYDSVHNNPNNVVVLQ